jgi:nicotinamide-nucleotide amidase
MQFENKVLSKEILFILYESGKTLSTAESCTSGKVAESITLMPGASAYFTGGIVAYSEEVKKSLLNVPEELIEEKTVVSEEVAIRMAEGACEVLNTDYAIATTGVAGPGGGTIENPVGTIWIAAGKKGEMRTVKLTENDGRDINVTRATFRALQLLLEVLKEDFPQPDLSEVPVPEAK